MKHCVRWIVAGLGLMALLIARPIQAEPVRITATPAPAASPPFRLPFTDPPGPSTWYLGQGYGNTIGAYFQRDTSYLGGQGLHFGVDFSAPCGTSVVAIGDGAVAEVDDLIHHGAAPHNLILQLDAGYSTLYGHLLERSKLKVGERVTRGQPVGLSGDPFGTCHSAPHLHLEIRSPDYLTGYNPMTLIDADWNALALVGAYQRGFERDLSDPRKWQFPDDQPDTKFGGPLLNNFAQPWPPDWYRRR